MSIRLLIDMNLSPDWVGFLAQHGWTSVHWSSIGDPRASDRTIMDWAKSNSYVVFTHDLDFGALLALTHANGPSVLQVRSQDTFPSAIGQIVLAALKQHETDLVAGALVVIDYARSRVRVLPI